MMSRMIIIFLTIALAFRALFFTAMRSYFTVMLSFMSIFILLNHHLASFSLILGNKVLVRKAFWRYITLPNSLFNIIADLTNTRSFA